MALIYGLRHADALRGHFGQITDLKVLKANSNDKDRLVVVRLLTLEDASFDLEIYVDLFHVGKENINKRGRDFPIFKTIKRQKVFIEMPKLS